MKRWGVSFFALVLFIACGGATNPLKTDRDGAAVVPEEDSGYDSDGAAIGDASGDVRKDAPAVIDSGLPVKCENVCPMNGGACVNGTCLID